MPHVQGNVLKNVINLAENVCILQRNVQERWNVLGEKMRWDAQTTSLEAIMPIILDKIRIGLPTNQTNGRFIMEECQEVHLRLLQHVPHLRQGTLPILSTLYANQ